MGCIALVFATAIGIVGADGVDGLVARKAMDPSGFAHVKYDLLGRNYWTLMVADY